MRRVVILGNSGSGKSRLARRLGRALDLPIVHLDPLYYDPRWAHGDPAAFRQRVGEALAGDAWIVDGGFLSLVGDLTLPRAELIVWLQHPRWLALMRALWRCLDPTGAFRPDLPAGCRDAPSRDMLADIWNYDRRTLPEIERGLAQLAPAVSVRRLAGDRAVEAFLTEFARD
jgi:adenylate kinase family enzyme